MGNFSIWHWLVVLISLSIFLVPAWLIFKKAGYPGWASVLLCIPMINIVVLWWFALAKWPALTKA